MISKTCGQDLYDDFVELRAGAAAAMEQELRESFSTSSSTASPSDPVQDIPAPTGNSEDTNSSLSMPAAHQPPPSSTPKGFPNSPTMPVQMPAPGLQGRSTATTSAVRLPEARWLLICVQPPKLPTSLAHLDLYFTFDDKKFFSTLKKSYAALKGKWHSWLSLKGVKTIQFVQVGLLHRLMRCSTSLTVNSSSFTLEILSMYVSHPICPRRGWRTTIYTNHMTPTYCLR
jgi:hypothetical protein